MSKESIREFMKRRKTADLRRIKANGFTDTEIEEHVEEVHEEWKVKKGYVPLKRKKR